RIGPQARRGRRSILDVLTCDRNAACGPIWASPKGSAPAAPSTAGQRGSRRPVLTPFGRPPIITAWTRTRVHIFVGQDTIPGELAGRRELVRFARDADSFDARRIPAG